MNVNDKKMEHFFLTPLYIFIRKSTRHLGVNGESIVFAVIRSDQMPAFIFVKNIFKENLNVSGSPFFTLHTYTTLTNIQVITHIYIVLILLY
jgi:hypothetical protein